MNLLLPINAPILSLSKTVGPRWPPPAFGGIGGMLNRLSYFKDDVCGVLERAKRAANLVRWTFVNEAV